MPCRKRVLVCPLDWGLGHAARCVPVIRALAEEGLEVVIGAAEGPLALLREEFPGFETIFFRGMRIRYSAKGSMAEIMVRQIPSIIHNIILEHNALRKIIGNHRIDAVISDNRFGLWTRKIPCIYITHQVMIKVPGRSGWIEKAMHRLHRMVMGRYSECWIPDDAGYYNLSGDLSHKYALPPRCHYIGPLSRFTPAEDEANNSGGEAYDILALISGPEPQRSLFERIVVEQLKSSAYRSLLVRGLPHDKNQLHDPGNIEIYNHLPTPLLMQKLRQSAVVLSRPGYSTLMDLAVTGNHAILVPTPGQTEQEYLAARFSEAGVYFSVKQSQLNLAEAFPGALRCSGLRQAADRQALRRRILNLSGLLG